MGLRGPPSWDYATFIEYEFTYYYDTSKVMVTNGHVWKNSKCEILYGKNLIFCNSFGIFRRFFHIIWYSDQLNTTADFFHYFSYNKPKVLNKISYVKKCFEPIIFLIKIIESPLLIPHESQNMSHTVTVTVHESFRNDKSGSNGVSNPESINSISCWTQKTR